MEFKSENETYTLIFDTSMANRPWTLLNKKNGKEQNMNPKEGKAWKIKHFGNGDIVS